MPQTSRRPTGRRRRRGVPAGLRRAPEAPRQTPLYVGSDHGRAVRISPAHFAPAQRGGGWGAYAEPFLRTNARAFEALGVQAQLVAGEGGADVRLVPGGCAGAVPLRSAQTQRVVGGFVVQPRFGWAGVGSVLSETGWHAAPELLSMPLVPGSGREVPSWVIAGPVLHRLAELLRALRRGYREAEETLQRPRGRILWSRYLRESLARGRWHQLPCRFPDLAADPRVRRLTRWTLEHIYFDLVKAAPSDPMARALASMAQDLLRLVSDVLPLVPSRRDLQGLTGPGSLAGAPMQRGIEAISWIYDERGLGGGRELDGLAWQLRLDQAWEAYVESAIRREAAMTGGVVKVGRQGETTFPLHWSDPLHRSLGHLVPDIVVHRGRHVHVVDAKYKAHLAELDEHGWRNFTEERQARHRADLHQVLAYASLFDAETVTATLVYPLRRATLRALRERGHDVTTAELFHGGRHVRLELRGMAFGAGR